MKRKNASDITNAADDDNIPTELDSKMESASDCSSNESLYEIRLNEFLTKDELSDFDLRMLVVRCSACGSQINHNSEKEVKKHRKLSVITCKNCYEFYGSSEFSQDESGNNYCTWCGNGGRLLVCDYCPNGFCSPCIRRNFGRAEISETTKEGWKCYVCNKKRLKPKMKFCDLIMSLKNKIAIKKEKRFVPISNTFGNTPVPEMWLQSAFDESQEACKVFCKKVSKLRSIGLVKKKSIKHIVKKMEDLIKEHKTSLKNTVLMMNQNYTSYVKHHQAAELEHKNNVETVDISNDNENSRHSFSDCIIENDVGQKSQDDQMISEDKSKAERIQAKLKLLKSSSDSDSAEAQSPTLKVNDSEKLVPDTNLKSNGKMDEQSSNGDSIIEIDDTPVKELPESNSEKSGELKNKLNRKIDLSFSDMSSSDFENDKPNVDQLVEEVDKQVESAEDECMEDELDPSNDPKLKLKPNVELIPCDHLLKEGETSMIIGDMNDKEDKLDKLVDSLCRFPRTIRLSKKSEVPKAKRRSGPPKSKMSAKQLLLESSSSISLSSEEDEDQRNIQVEKKPVMKSKSPAKDCVKSDDDSSSSNLALDSYSETEENLKKSSKRKKKVESDSSDDFVPVRKKKYDKLLRAPLLSDDDDSYDKKPRERKEKKAPKMRKAILLEAEKKSSKSTATSSSEESDPKRKKQSRKRRRIKKMGSSTEDDDKEQDKDTPTKGRKNIRKIVSQKKLAMSTKEAQAEEKERKQRIAERQKLYNKIQETISDSKDVIIRKMVLEVDPESKEEIVQIHPHLVCKLKPHQVEGVKFMWECTIESVKDLNKPGSGCILAHCMGLGKTLQVIAYLHTCLTNPIVSKAISRAMVICPYNTALNWATEFNYWLEDVEGDIKVHQLTTVKTNMERLDILKYWFEEGGVIIVSYDIFRRLSSEKIPKLKKKDKGKLAECLLDPGPDIVVCDEGHILKNEKSAISVATNKLLTRRRIILTGTPLQNNLKEYHCMLSFVKPNLLGTMVEFRNRFVNPIMNGQYDDSNEYDVKLMKKRIHILHKLLDGCVQRCDYSTLTKFLPPKHEFVISVKLSEIQAKMYECYLDKLSTAKQDAKIMGRALFADFTHLRSIWTHPYMCQIAHERYEQRRFLKDDGDDDEEFINDESLSEPESSFSSGTTSEEEKSKNVIGRGIYKTRSRMKNASGEEEEEEEEDDDEPKEKQWYHEFITEADKYHIELSGKMVLLLEILKECERIGDKLLLFSQSLLALDMIEDILSYSASESSQKDSEDKDVLGTWCKGIDYFRMDGTTSADFRKNYIDMFNDLSNERSRLFLISTRAGSLGTNLVGANRVVIFDTSWNPSHDVQAIFRVYRFGQLKPVYIYRLLAQGTMEEKIYDRQVTKISLSYRVVDEQQIDRHFSAADLAELYSFERNSTKQRPTPMVPKDRLLAELLIRNKDWIVTYHEHDSLLQNETETDLTEEERQAAWTEYENEKEGHVTSSYGDANSLMNDLDTSTLTNEPDFSEDYEGRKIPDLKTIVEYLFERLKKSEPDNQKNPIEFKKRLLSSVYAIRQSFQEKHVKILRMKQEYCTRGSVPNSINKYMDELSQILKTTGDYINRLSAAINSEQNKQQKMQQQMFQRATGYQPTGTSLPNMGRMNAPRFLIHGPVTYTQMNLTQKMAYAQYMQNLKSSGNFQPPSNNVRGPVITEVDDSTPSVKIPPSSSTIISAPSTSTVTIDEIT